MYTIHTYTYHTQKSIKMKYLQNTQIVVLLDI